jgi:DNA-directed RNA polymerase alpha subunit
MSPKLSLNQTGRLAHQLIEVMRLTSDGLRPYEEVQQVLNGIIEGSFRTVPGPLAAADVDSRWRIDELELSTRTRGILRLAKIERVVDLTDLSETEVSAIRNVGPAVLREIKAALATAGLSLRTALSP